MLSVVLGEKYASYSDQALSKLLTDTVEFNLAVTHLENFRDEDYWRTRRLAGTSHPAYRSSQGRFFAEISQNPAETVVEILKTAAADSTVAAASMSQKNMEKINIRRFWQQI